MVLTFSSCKLRGTFGEIADVKGCDSLNNKISVSNISTGPPSAGIRHFRLSSNDSQAEVGCFLGCRFQGPALLRTRQGANFMTFFKRIA